MITRERKKSEGRGPEGAYMAFATNMPPAVPAQVGDRDRLQGGQADAHARAGQGRERQGTLLRGVANGAQRAGHDAPGQACGRRRAEDPDDAAQDHNHSGGMRGARHPAAAQASTQGAARSPHLGSVALEAAQAAQQAALA